MIETNALCSPAADRNKEVIADVLADTLPGFGMVLVVAEGSGQHVACFAERFPALDWQPSDPDPAARQSIAAYTSDLANVRTPIDLDVTASDWEVRAVDAVLCINMIHISPWSATDALMAGAARVLLPGGVLFTYGPYTRDGQHTAQSNAAFDASLRSQNPDWGVRDISDVAAAAEQHGLVLTKIIAMPANNYSLIFRR